MPLTDRAAGTPDARPEIWAHGFRNPWRMSFDRETGELWLGDVGGGIEEEVNRVDRGGNYGWPLFEGETQIRTPGPGLTARSPVFAYSHRGSTRAVIGGYVYRGSALPSFRGAYLYGDFQTGDIWALFASGPVAVSNTLVSNVPFPSAFGEDQDGELYVCSIEGGIFRFEESAQE